MENTCCYPLSCIVSINNCYYFNNIDVNQLIMQLGHLGTFMTQDVNVIQKKIEYFSWIQNVSIRKQWPDILKMHIVVHIPIARWNDFSMISTTGLIFNVSGKFQEDSNQIIPALYGPEGKDKEVLLYYYIFNEMLKSINLQIKSIRMDMRCSWTVILRNDMHLKLGRKDIIERLYYFIKIYPILLYKINENCRYIDYVDLRYNLGFAIKWIAS